MQRQIGPPTCPSPSNPLHDSLQQSASETLTKIKHKKPRNPAFAQQLRNFLLTRPTKDDELNEKSPLQTIPLTAHNSPNLVTATQPLQHLECTVNNDNPPSPPAHNTKQTDLHANNPHNDKGSTSTAAAPSNHQSHNDSGQSVISTSNTTYQPPDPFVLINDGTQRLTIRWRPDSFDTLANDQSAWDHTLTATLHQLFQAQISRIAAVKWGDNHTDQQHTTLQC
jgi:hypothetical protein